MTPNYILHLAASGVALDVQAETTGAAAGWWRAGEVAFDVPDFAEALTELRNSVVASDDPNPQVYLGLPLDQMKLMSISGENATRTDVGNALEDTTPYEIEELRFDWRPRNGETHIAAVAKETLAEATEFAKGHGFDPIGFLAIPKNGWGKKYAFFGGIAGSEDTLAPPPVAYVLIDRPAVAPPATAILTPAPATESAPAVVKEVDVPSPAAEQDTAEAPMAILATPVAEAAVDATPEVPEPVSEPEILFPSEGETPVGGLGPAPVVAPLDTPTAAIAAPAVETDTPPAPQDRTPIIGADPETSTNTQTVTPVTRSAITAAGAAPKPELGPDGVAAAAAMQQHRETVALAKSNPVRGKPKYLGLILLALLLLFLFAVAAWASTSGRDVIARWLGNAPSVDQPAPQVAGLPSTTDTAETTTEPMETAASQPVAEIEPAPLPSTPTVEAPLAPTTLALETPILEEDPGAQLQTLRDDLAAIQSTSARPSATTLEPAQLGSVEVSTFEDVSVIAASTETLVAPRAVSQTPQLDLAIPSLDLTPSLQTLSAPPVETVAAAAPTATEIPEIPQNIPSAALGDPTPEAVQAAVAVFQINDPLGALAIEDIANGTRTDAARRYAVTGIWIAAPAEIETPSLSELPQLRARASALQADRTTPTLVVLSQEEELFEPPASTIANTPFQPQVVGRNAWVEEDVPALTTALPEGPVVAVIQGAPPSRPPLRGEEPIVDTSDVVVILGQPSVLPPMRNGETREAIATSDEPAVAIPVILAQPVVAPPLRSTADTTPDVAALEDDQNAPAPNVAEVAETITPPVQDEQNPEATLAEAPEAGAESSETPAQIADAEADDAEGTPETVVETVETLRSDFALAGDSDARPALRPTGLREDNERLRLGGYTRAELSELRPSLRPASVIRRPEPEPEPIVAPAPAADPDAIEATVVAAVVAAPAPPVISALAVAASSRPKLRPRAVVRAAARAAQAPAAEPATTQRSGPVATRNETARATAPSRTSVTRAATEENVLRLNRVALVGVFGRDSSRKALVRLPNGRFSRVGVGDRLDGGRVAAISQTQLRYVKSGRNITLKMPRG